MIEPMDSDELLDIDQFDPQVVQQAAFSDVAKSVEQDGELKAYISRRKIAYSRVFNKNDADVAFVLADLAAFTRCFQARFDADARRHALLEGRAEVYYRISDYVGLDNDTLYIKLSKARITQGE